MESHALKGNALNLGTPVDNPGACQIDNLYYLMGNEIRELPRDCHIDRPAPFMVLEGGFVL